MKRSFLNIKKKKKANTVLNNEKLDFSLLSCFKTRLSSFNTLLKIFLKGRWEKIKELHKFEGIQ